MNRHVIRYAMVLSVVFLVYASTVANADDPSGVRRPSYPTGFAPGTRVVLLADEPVVGEGLVKGMAGTILCCDAADCTGSLLVSWDLWTGGGDETDRCATRLGGPYPAGSTTWVDPAQILLGRPFDIEGILQVTEEGCLYVQTEEGEAYNLVVDPEFQEMWWVVKSGDRVRVRGLLNQSVRDAEAKGACPQLDGDIYCPIVTAGSWADATCADRWVCGFDYGDSVVLVGEGNPDGARDLPRGATGTIICSNEDTNAILVSWNFWTNGGDPNDYMLCSERLAGLFAPGSTWWVSPADLAKPFKTACGTLQEIRISSGDKGEDMTAVGLFVENVGFYYLPDLGSDTSSVGQDFVAAGLFAPYATIPDGMVVTSGDVDLIAVILSSTLLQCPASGCCEPAYKPGDRVRLLVDEPAGAVGLFTDAGGTVVCCNSTDPTAPILVSWDFWTGGHTGDDRCDSDTTVRYYSETSGWWMACTEIERIVLPDLYDLGGRYQGFTPPSVVAGKAGQGIEITGAISNRGGTQSGVFFIAIYASADEEITADDYRLTLAAADIEAGGMANISWAGQFPTTIPAGTYNIGWLIDPSNLVTEKNETNNTAVIKAGQLTVKSE
ncbi:MAG: CARDB domain-containing protein [Phycisphaerales bacterium]